jgi:hypothetical protein
MRIILASILKFVIFFIVSYVLIVRFCKKKIFDWAIIGGDFSP